MNMLSLYLLTLITAPVDAPVPPFPAELVPLLTGVAVQLEIWDRREAGRWHAEPAATIAYLRTWHAILKDAPPLRYADRLPTCAAAEAAMQFNRDHQRWLNGELAAAAGRADPNYREELRDWAAENSRLADVWCDVRQATANDYYSGRRGALQRLRDRLGDDAVLLGELPPCVPVWRFQTISTVAGESAARAATAPARRLPKGP